MTREPNAYLCLPNGTFDEIRFYAYTTYIHLFSRNRLSHLLLSR